MTFSRHRSAASRKITKVVAFVAAASLLATGLGTTLAGAAESSALRVIQVDDLIIASGTRLPAGAVEVTAMVDKGQGSLTVDVDTAGRFLVGFSLPEDFAGVVKVSATGNQIDLTKSIEIKPATGAAAMTPTTALPATTIPATTPVANIEYGPLLPAVMSKAPSEYVRDISNAPLANNSAAVVANLANQVATRYGGIAAFNYSQYGASTFTVSPNTPRYDVKFDDCQNKGSVPPQLYGEAEGAHFKNVPIPDNARVANGTDQAITIYSPDTDQMWEFWVASKRGSDWYACWGGRVDNASTATYFEVGMGSTATGLLSGTSSVRVREMQTGVINHAIAIAVPENAAWPAMSWPAQRTDGGSTDPNAPYEGQRFRLDPSINVDSLGLHPIAAAIAKAAQKYGFIVTDKAGAVAVSVEQGTSAKELTGVDPWDAMLNGTEGYMVMESFPWDKLQALPVNFGKP